MNKQIFVSHIHEERELALLIKEAIEVEFSGFIEIFVSSDGVSISAGSNFLKRIEDGLVNCIGAIYLISPISVKRNWINFELGAVWIRNAINQRSGKEEIPTLPFCHSNMTPIELPQPIGNLNAIIANQSSQLEFAFKSLQSAVGGKGVLRTDFDKLAQDIIEFEAKYTLGDRLKDFFKLFNGDTKALIEHCEKQPSTVGYIKLELGTIENETIKKIRELETGALKRYLKLNVKSSSIGFGPSGAISGGETDVELDISLLLDFKDLLINT
jgi:hypothetical protein